jgi:hypothetical protein
VIVVAVETTMAGLRRRLRAIWRVASPPSRVRPAFGLALAVSLPLLFTSQFDPHHLRLPGLVFLTAVCASTVVGGVVPGWSARWYLGLCSVNRFLPTPATLPCSSPSAF